MKVTCKFVSSCQALCFPRPKAVLFCFRIICTGFLEIPISCSMWQIVLWLPDALSWLNIICSTESTFWAIHIVHFLPRPDLQFTLPVWSIFVSNFFTDDRLVSVWKLFDQLFRSITLFLTQNFNWDFIFLFTQHWHVNDVNIADTCDVLLVPVSKNYTPSKFNFFIHGSYFNAQFCVLLSNLKLKWTLNYISGNFSLTQL